MLYLYIIYIHTRALQNVKICDETDGDVDVDVDGDGETRAGNGKRR